MATVDGLSQGLQELRDSIAQTAQAAPQLARQEIRREGRAYFRGAVVASVITSLLVGIPLILLAERFAAYTTANEARAAQSQASEADLRRLAEGAHDLGLQANAELARRGLATVTIPAPGSVPDSQVLTAAATAQVAAKIASESIVVPAPGKSPPCLAEPTHCQGPQGVRGEPPVGWTVEEKDGSTVTCQRVADFVPEAPRYRCTRSSPSPSAPKPAPTTPPPSSSPSDPAPLPAGR